MTSTETSILTFSGPEIMRNKSPYMRRTSLAFLLICSALSTPPRLFSQTQTGGKGANVRAVNRLPSKEKRWALVIGVSKYEDSNITPLPGANNDAKALHDALRDYAGFDERQIILLTTDETKERQPTKNNILRLLGNLSGTVPRDGLLLVAFSGHGIERQNQAFLLPSDTPYNDNLRVLERTALSVQNDVKELIRDTGVGQVVILLDACRNDPANGRSDSDNPLTEAYKKGFSFDVRNKEVEAFATLYATSIGERAYEYAREGKGYFTWAFIEGLKGDAANERGEVTLGGLVRYVEKYVPQQVRIDLGGGRVQRPFSVIEGYRAEELVLGIAGSKNASLSPTSSSERKTGEQLYWGDVEKRGTVAAYESYMSAYPNGEFERVAKLRLGHLKWEIFKPIAQGLVKYAFVEELRDGLARAGFVVGDKSYIRALDKTGKEAFRSRYNNVSSFSEGLSTVTRVFEGNVHKQGVVDKTGKEIVPPKYDRIYHFQGGLAPVSSGDKWGFIDRTGQEVIPIKYQRATNFSGARAAVSLDGKKWGLINRIGEEVTPFIYDHIREASEGLWEARLNGKAGFLDTAGDEVIPFIFDEAQDFKEGVAAVVRDGKLGFIDRAGKEVIPIKFPRVANWIFHYTFSEGLAVVELNGKYGFINRTGEEVIPPVYEWAYTFERGLAQVKLNGKWGFIDRTGKVVIPIKYDDEPWCRAFYEDGFIGVVLNDGRGFVDVYGNEHFDF